MMQPYALSALRAYKRRWQALLFPTESTSFSISAMMLLTIAVALGNAVVIVQVVNLYHRIAAAAPLNTAVAMRHGWEMFSLEQRLHLAVEPAVQRYLSHDVRTPLGAIPAALIRRAIAWIYLHALPSWIFAALAWSYVYKGRHFPLLRDVTIVSILLAVVCQRLFPAAPPRFVLQRAPYNLVDWTYSRTSLDPRLMHMVGFNPYAAFPSVHVLWALIPALCLAVGARHPLWWAITAGYPLAMIGLAHMTVALPYIA